MIIHRSTLTLLVITAALIGCNKVPSEQSVIPASEATPAGAAQDTVIESPIPAEDQVDNTTEVEAIAHTAKPTEEQIDQYNKDEIEMIDKWEEESGRKKP